MYKFCIENVIRSTRSASQLIIISVFGYEFEAEGDVKFPADWSISDLCMANEWERAYKEQYEEFANLIQSDDSKRRARLLDESHSIAFLRWDLRVAKIFRLNDDFCYCECFLSFLKRI